MENGQNSCNHGHYVVHGHWKPNIGKFFIQYGKSDFDRFVQSRFLLVYQISSKSLEIRNLSTQRHSATLKFIMGNRSLPTKLIMEMKFRLQQWTRKTKSAIWSFFLGNLVFSVKGSEARSIRFHHFGYSFISALALDFLDLESCRRFFFRYQCSAKFPKLLSSRETDSFTFHTGSK